jgi:hypothetical protein
MDPILLNWMKAMARRNPAPGWLTPLLRDRVRASAAFVKQRYHSRLAHRAIAGRVANLDDLEHFLSEKFIPLSAPLVLISQAERSGGTVLSQLFDGHPQIAAYPHELRFGGKINNPWPVLNATNGAAENFLRLMDYNFPRLVKLGFAKGYQNPERFRFALITRLQFAIFKRMCDQKAPASQRDLFDYFFTAFFNGWLDYQGRIEEKRYITAFAPRLANDPDNMEHFAKVYPDGFLIQVVREPKSWFGSISHHAKTSLSGSNIDADLIVDRWVRSGEGMLRNNENFGKRHIVLKFEDVVARPEATMRAVAEVLGIEYCSALAQPTFNGNMMRANSSFSVEQAGLIQAPLERGKVVSEANRALIEGRTGPLYEAILTKALKV